MKKLCYLLLFCSGFLHAQTDPHLDAFNVAFRKNIKELFDVYSFRGAAFHCDYRYEKNYRPIVENFLARWENAEKKPALIFYSKTTDSLSIWLFTDTNVYYHEQAIHDTLLVAMEREMRSSLAVENTRGMSSKKKKRGMNLVLRKAGKKEWENKAQALTDVLLPKEMTAHLLGRGHLFVLPELNIGQIPFWLLTPYGNGSFLVDSMSFSWVPHVCKFTEFAEGDRALGSKRAMVFERPLVVGNPKYHSDLKLHNLPGAEAEAMAVAQVLHDTAMTGEHATLTQVRRQIQQADLIYLATHASCSMDDILNKSWIAFTPEGNYGKGLLTLYEVQRMMIDCRMAVLSACQTGYGKVMEGGFVGLGRAFFKAGVDFTVMSLWSVNDASTEFLMTEFMKNNLQVHAYQPAEPLRLAILETKKKYPHPAFWAPFVLFGFTY